MAVLAVPLDIMSAMAFAFRLQQTLPQFSIVHPTAPQAFVPNATSDTFWKPAAQPVTRLLQSVLK